MRGVLSFCYRYLLWVEFNEKNSTRGHKAKKEGKFCEDFACFSMAKGEDRTCITSTYSIDSSSSVILLHSQISNWPYYVEIQTYELNNGSKHPWKPGFRVPSAIQMLQLLTVTFIEYGIGMTFLACRILTQMYLAGFRGLRLDDAFVVTAMVCFLFLPTSFALHSYENLP